MMTRHPIYGLFWGGKLHGLQVAVIPLRRRVSRLAPELDWYVDLMMVWQSPSTDHTAASCV